MRRACSWCVTTALFLQQPDLMSLVVRSLISISSSLYRFTLFAATDGFPYHYHPSVETGMRSVKPGTTLGYNFTAYWIAPKYCFKGNVTAQPNFWTATKSQWNYDRSTVFSLLKLFSCETHCDCSFRPL